VTGGENSQGIYTGKGLAQKYHKLFGKGVTGRGGGSEAETGCGGVRDIRRVSRRGQTIVL
jgi:hypothetical protein